MSRYCPKCSLTFCDCVIEPVVEAKPEPPRHISESRAGEMRELIADLQSGKLSANDGKRLYKEAQKQMQIEIGLMRELQDAVFKSYAKGKSFNFDDFPLKDF